MVKNYDHDIASLTAAAHFLETVIKHRLERFFAEKKETSEFHLPDLLPDKELRFSRFPMLSSLSAQEYLVLSLGLVPHLKPNFFEQLLLEFLPQSGDFPQLGGARGKNFRGFLPTGETALFLLGGDNLAKRLEVQKLFGEEHFFAKKHVLWLEEVPEGEPAMSGKIVLSQEYLDLLTTGKASKPRFSMNFPAQLLETEMEWNDLVLNDDTLLQIRELEAWINHHPTLMTDWGMRKKFKPGYRTLFHGPPGTGKTLTAT
ncbi:MAG: ATP-binding protein, partial [Bacteroidota bacterium]